MPGIEWHEGQPPDFIRARLLLVIGHAMGGNFDAGEDSRPDIFVGHFHEGKGYYVPARVSGMSEREARPALDVKYWAEINLPDGVELRSLEIRHLKG